MGSGFKIRKRRLPHWTIDGAIYFLTIRAYTVFTAVECWAIKEHIKHGNKKYYALVCCVVMPDHAHIILQPNEGIELKRINSGIKGVSARIVNLMRNSRGQIWQHESYDRIIRNERELLQKVNYVARNPVKAGLIDEIHNYVGWYFNEEIILF
jgi:REP element-mobilizing transposase RayT